MVWGHLLWVMPWMLFILQPTWQRVDWRLILIAQTLGWSRIFLLEMSAYATPYAHCLRGGIFSRIAQYMPTLWLGAGRFRHTTKAILIQQQQHKQIYSAQAFMATAITALYFCPDRVSRQWVVMSTRLR